MTEREFGIIDEEKLKELEEEKKKRRRVGRLITLWRRFRRHKMGVFGLSIIVFITLLGILAPLIANPGRIVPFHPQEPDAEAQYLPPLSYGNEKDDAASQQIQGTEKTVAAFYVNKPIDFVNGISQENVTYFPYLSKIDSITAEGSETELWAGSEGIFNTSSGRITLTDTTFSGTTLVDYRVGGKFAQKFIPTFNEITEIKFIMKVDADTSESKWPEDIDVYVYESSNFDTDDPIGHASLEGFNIISGPRGSVFPAGYDFRTGHIRVTAGQSYWIVLDTNLLQAEARTVDLRFYVDSATDSFDPLHLNARNWNAQDGWNDVIMPDEGWLPYLRIYHATNDFHILGTDSLGRDILSATIHGARTSLFVAGVAISLQVLIGIFLGAIAGYFGGFIDNIIMRITDLFLSIPNIFLILIAITIWENISLLFIALTLGLFNWSGTARIVRAEFLSLREMEFTDAARALGVHDRSIIFKHLLPNAMAPVIVTSTLGIATVILIEAGLSFLGFGDPSAVSWGTAIQWGMTGNTLRFAPWVATIPGLAIFVAVVGFNLMGDALRDALDPRLKQ